MVGYKGTRVEGPGEVSLGPRVERITRFVEIWWRRWQDAAFALFTPRKKWCKERRAVAVGDVVLLKADKKLGPASFRLAKVAAIHPDEDGVVRSVTLSVKSRRKQRVTTVEQVY